MYSTLLFTVDNFKKYLETIHYHELTEDFSVIKIYKQYIMKSKLIFMTMNKLKQD